MNLSTEQYTLAKTDTQAFFEQYKTDSVRLLQIIQEIEIEQGLSNYQRIETLRREANQINKQRTALYTFIVEHLPDPRQQYILIARYLQNKKQQDVVHDLGYSNLRYVQRLGLKALKAFADAI